MSSTRAHCQAALLATCAICGCGDDARDETDASVSDATKDAARCDADPDPPIVADCALSVYVDLGWEPGGLPTATLWFARFDLPDLDASKVLKVLMCDPHSENTEQCPPYWDCDRDEDPEHPGCVLSTIEIAEHGTYVACGLEHTDAAEAATSYRFQTALLEITHRQ